MWWWLLGAVAAAAVISVVVAGIIDKNKIKQVLRNKGVSNAIIKEIDACSNRVKLDSLNGEIEIQGDDVDIWDLDEGITIYS